MDGKHTNFLNELIEKYPLGHLLMRSKEKTETIEKVPVYELNERKI